MDPEVKHHCGLFGVFGSPEAAALTYKGIFSLQHRGQEAAGMVYSDGLRLTAKIGMGLVNEVFSGFPLDTVKASLAVGHLRYSTTGTNRLANIQPIVINYWGGQIAVAHNGNLVNAAKLHDEYESLGSIFRSSTDSEIFLHMMADRANHGRSDEEALAWVLRQTQGAFSLLFLRPDKIIAARDPGGFRPLALGRLGPAWVVASETCAFDQVGATYVREVEPGEIVTIDRSGVSSRFFADSGEVRRSHCIFEHVYFARPDSTIFGENVHRVRIALGRALAHEAPVDADVVSPVPDSGNSAAMGFSRESGIPLDACFIRNHYVGRTFIQPSGRDRSVEMKLNVLKETVAGRRVVIVDDSIVRGNTSRRRVGLLRSAGAKEIHLRISCPPIIDPCYYGIDFQTKKELIANSMTVDEIRRFLGIDSLYFLSVKGMLSAVGKPADFCTACWTGNYPVPPAEGQSKEALEREVLVDLF
jgi:amidophosphoribosyltransferase